METTSQPNAPYTLLQVILRGFEGLDGIWRNTSDFPVSPIAHFNGDVTEAQSWEEGKDYALAYIRELLATK